MSQDTLRTERRALVLVLGGSLVALASLSAMSCADSDTGDERSPDSATVVPVPHDDGDANSDLPGPTEDSGGDGGCTASEADCTAVEAAEWFPVATKHEAQLGLAAIWGTGPNDVWVVGARGSVLHWDGSAWAETALGTIQSLNAIGGTGPNDVWVASTPDQVFHLTGYSDGALQWSLAPPIVNSNLAKGKLSLSVLGMSSGQVLIGSEGMFSQVSALSRGVISDDGGVVWTGAIPGQVRNWQTIIRGLWSRGSNDVWAVGFLGSSTVPGSSSFHTFGATDGGAWTWDELDTQSASPLNAVWGAGTGEVWSVGDNGTIRYFSSATSEVINGAVWTIIDSPTTENLRSLWGSSPADVWAVGDHGTFVHYDGHSWNLVPGWFPDSVFPDLHGVWGSGPNDVWAVGDGVIMHHSTPDAGAQGVVP